MILIGLGANLESDYGSAVACLKRCPTWLAERGIAVTHASHIWSSAPVPMSDQPWYSNAVCAVATQLTPHEVLAALNDIEAAVGRVRAERNAPRVLDLDLLAYHDDNIDDDVLSLPHPRMHERAFVLYPLQEIAPDWVHPVLHKSVDNFILNLPQGQEIRKNTGEYLSCTAGDNYV